MIRRKATFVGIAAGAIALIAIPSAFAAATTYTIKSGTHTGSVKYTGSTSKITFKDGQLSLGCKAGTADGAITLGKKVAANKVGTITKTTWTSCSGPFQTVFLPKQSGTWKLNASGKTSKGVTKVFVSGVTAQVKQKGSASNCTFTVTGAADGSYSNSTHKLSLAPGSHKLKVTKEIGTCFGLISKGDTVTFKAVYDLTGKVSIASN